jgi:hypothetical protein
VADRLKIDDDGAIDELVMSNATVHLEHLGDGLYMLIAENERERVHLEIPSRTNRAGVPKAFVYERIDRSSDGSGS